MNTDRLSKSISRTEEMDQYLSRDDELLAYVTLLSPLANEPLRSFVLADHVIG
jgi:hypothetical protein